MPWNFGTESCWIVCLQEALGMPLPLGLNVPKLVKAVPDPLTVFPSPACLPVMAPHRWRLSEILHRTDTFLQNTYIATGYKCVRSLLKNQLILLLESQMFISLFFLQDVL